MALDKINQDWKKQVNTGAHGRAVGPLTGTKAKQIDKKFWKAKNAFTPVKEITGKNVEPTPQPADARTLFGPKSKWKAYVRVKMMAKTVGPNVEANTPAGQDTPPLRVPHIMLGGRNGGRRTRPVPPR
jgi:hypothetical protein